MKHQLTMLVCALALTACANHAARDRLGIEDATLLHSGFGVPQDEAAGAPIPMEPREAIIGDREADASLERPYRAPWDAERRALLGTG